MTVVGCGIHTDGASLEHTSMVEEYGTNNIYAFHLSTGPRLGIATAASTHESR